MHKTGLMVFGVFLIGLLLFALYIAKPVYLFYTEKGFSNHVDNVISVKRNSSAWDVIQQLHSHHMIQHPRVIYYFNRLNGSASLIKAGVYSISSEDTAASVMKKIEHGDVLALPFTIIAGKQWADIKQDIMRAQWLNVTTECRFSLMGKPIENPEGLLLADTYLYDANSDSDHLLERANRELNQYIEHRWNTRAPNLPFHNAYELLIAASIIEKETAVPEERALIASVIINRLKNRMRLQMDPTVIYAMDEQWNGTLSKSDLKVDSPYNTYRYAGLPPTPIAMVSRASIDAAAHPEKTSFLYFVAKGNGRHQFSTTYTQQQTAIQQFMKRRPL